MQLKELIEQCGQITESKGFDVTQIRTQAALFVTEIAEMLEHVSNSNDEETDNFTYQIDRNSFIYEKYRAIVESYKDESAIMNKDAFLEELADFQIRLASFIHGNKLTDDFMQALKAKIEKNKTRPMKHGKGF